MLKLIRHGKLFAPEEMGEKDILIAGDKILKIADSIQPPQGLETEVIDAKGKTVAPGLIDTHIHYIGAGGGGGFDSRSGLAHLSMFTRAGVTTCVGCMGIDKIGFSLESMLVRANALEQEGLTAYMLAGSYTFPSISITDSLMKDLYLIDKVIGVKIALWESLGSHPSEDMLIKTISEARLGSRLGNKAGVVVCHLGTGKARLSRIPDLMERLGIPNETFVMTHINRSEDLFEQSVDCGKRGITLDLSGNVGGETCMTCARAYRRLIDSGVPAEHITMTSDGNAGGRQPNGENVLGAIGVCIREIRSMVREEGFSLTDALKLMTVNPARIYRLEQKGQLKEGKDADLLFLDHNLQVDTVIARGKVLLRDKEPVVRGALEEVLLDKLY